jgi:hypothetical protein
MNYMRGVGCSIVIVLPLASSKSLTEAKNNILTWRAIVNLLTICGCINFFTILQNPKMESLGKHILVEYYDCDRDILNLPHFIEE